LINRKVSMRLEEAGVKDLIVALSEFDGLNIVADEALTSDKQLTVSVRDVPLKELMSYIARNMGIAFHLSENMIWVTESPEPPGAGPTLETRVYRLRQGFIPAPAAGGGGGGGDDAFSLGGGGGFGGEGDNELEDALETFLTDGPDGATYRIFRSRNLLIVKNSRENLRLVEELIRELDRQPLQVLIEARFITIGREDLLELGFDIPEFSLDGKDKDKESEVMTMDASSTFDAFKKKAVGHNLALTGILGNHTYKAVLHALEENGQARTLSAPRITVVNNQSARIRKGDKMYYFEEYEVQSVDEGQEGTSNELAPTGSPTELELGITLNVNVNIGNDGETIMLSLQPEIKQFQKWLNFTTSGSSDGENDTGTDAEQPGGLVSLPMVDESTVQTTVVVKSGETVVLGGMLQTKKNSTIRKIPILGDVPLIGPLFRHTEEAEEPEHLLIFVTGTVINDSGEFVEVRRADDGG